MTAMDWRAFLLLGLTWVIAVPNAAYSAGGAVPVVSGEIKPEFARILFSWPERVNFHASMSGRTLKVTFNKAAHPNLGAITGKLGTYVESARMEDDYTALITLKHPYPVRTFISSSSSGIDLLQIHSARFAKPEAPEKVAKAEAAPPAKKAEPKPAPKAVKPVPPVVAKQSAPAPLAEKKEEKKRPAAPAAPVTPVKVETIPPVKPAPKAETEAEKPVEKSPETKAEEQPVLVPLAKSDLPKVEELKKEAVKPAPKMEEHKSLAIEKPALEKKPTAKPVVTGGSGMLVATDNKKVSTDFHFPWTERTAAAAFLDGHTLWIVFNKPTIINLTALRSVIPPNVTAVDQLDKPDATVLRMTLSDPLSISVSKQADSYEWTVSLSRRSKAPETPIVAETINEPPAKPAIFLPVIETAEPIELIRPGSGEELIVVPVYKVSQGIFPARHFVDADVLRTAQGVVIAKENSGLRVVKLRNGLRLTTPDGALLSNALPTLKAGDYLAMEGNSQTFFPYDDWKVESPSAFTARAETLRHQIGSAPDPEVSRLRKKLAELYLGEGRAEETLGILNLIRATDPAYYQDYQLASMHGAANFLANRIEEASADFADPVLENEDEIDFWKRVITVMKGNEMKPIKFSEFHDQYEKSYPPEMQRRLALIAADQAIGDEAYPLALHIMDTLKPNKMIEPVKEYQQFMLGRIYVETGQVKQGEALLQKLVDESNDRFIRARATFTLATTKYKAGEIDKAELLKELDHLRILWRGDQLELNLLELLGDLYVGDGKYLEGLRAWKELLTHYPSTPNAQAIAIKMSETFVKLFNGGQAKEMTPLEALSIYYEFRDLTPIGKDGDTMIQGLADRLASVDLLDRAAALLEHQITYRLEKLERSRVGARLALIYLLNKQPQEAIKVLELTGYGNNDEALQLERTHLAAHAFAAIGDTKNALNLLKEDYTPEGKQIRLDIYWDSKDWPNVVTTAEELLAGRKDITAPLDDTESQTLLRLAIAYTFEDDTLQLQYLRDYFTPLMAQSPNKDAFDFITNDSGPISAANIQKVSQDMGRVKVFLDKYRQSVAKEGLSKAIK